MTEWLAMRRWYNAGGVGAFATLSARSNLMARWWVYSGGLRECQGRSRDHAAGPRAVSPGSVW